MSLQRYFPSTVVVIRHGEKPKDKDGLTSKSFTMDDLSEVGRARAVWLGKHFAPKFGQPAAILAQSDIDGDKYKSHRPIKTVQLIAEACFTPLYILKKESDKIFERITSIPGVEGKMVLVCWEHNTIIAPGGVLDQLGVSPLPKKWSKHDFDTAYVVRYDGQGKVASCTADVEGFPDAKL